MSTEHTTADQTWHDATAWARKALARARHHAGAPEEATPGLDPDLVVTVAAWLRWDRPPTSTAVMAVPSTVHTPRRLPAGTPYELHLLHQVHAHAELPEALTSACGNLVVIDRLYDNMGVIGERAPDGQVRTEITVQQPLRVLPRPEGTQPSAPHTVRCPLCDRDTGLQLRWDGQVGRALCPQGHGEWTPRPLIVQDMWEQLVQQAVSH